MIEDYQAKRRRARVIQRSLLAFGLILAIASAILTYYFASRAPAVEGPLTATAQVLVARRDIPARTVVTADDVMVVQTTAGVVPSGSLRDPAEAVGRILTQPVVQNEIIHPSRFSSSGTTGFAIFPEGQQPSGSAPDFRAMSLQVSDAQAVGGTVVAGDRVDILFSIAYVPLHFGTGASEGQDYAARILAENVLVLAKDETTLYTFRVDAAQAERIAAMSSAGAQIHLLLRRADDTRAPRASGAIFSSEAIRAIRAIPTVSPAPR